MTRPTRILAAVATLIGLVLALLVVLPLLLRGRIAQRAKVEINRNLNARVDWRDAGLSFFRHFPNLTLTLNDLTTVGVNRFQADTLAAVRHLRVVLSLPSVVGNVVGGRPIVVRAVELDQPRLSLITLEDGTANWNITKTNAEQAQAPAGAAKPMAISLRRLAISNGAVRFDNRRSKLKASLAGYNQSLSGDFSRSQVVIQTRADADTANVVFAGIPYLNRVKVGLTADVQADLAGKTYTVKNGELRLNDLKLALSGSARSAGKLLGLDLAFNAPSTNFRGILSLVPAVYAHDFDRVKTSGTVAVNGRVKGEYGDSAFPSFAINAKVNDAAFQYPDLPLPARSIVVDLSLTNPGGSPDSTVVKLDRFHLLLGSNPVDARLLLRTPVSDPDVDAQVSGKVDLADVRRTVKLQGVEQLAGTVAGNAAVRTRMSFVDKKQYDKVAASGNVDVRGLTVKTKTLPHPLSIQQASLALTPQRAQLKSFAGSVGSSDLEASGTLENLLGFALRDDELRGTATVHSNRFNLDEWRSGKSDLQIIEVPPKIDFGMTATIAELTYDKLKATNARGRLRIKDQRVTLEDFRMNALGGELALSGYYETTDPAKPKFDIALKLNQVDIPSAFQTFATVQALAPVAKYATGKVTTDLQLNGALGKNMMPLLAGLSGRGALQTSQLALHDFPAMNKLGDVTKLQFLNNPTLQPVHANFQIHGGRLNVAPFGVKLGPTTMNVSGSNGLDQSLDYALQFRVPRSELGGAANQAITGLVSKAGQAGINLNAAPEIPLGVRLGGTVTNPSVNVEAGNVASSVTGGVQKAVRDTVTQKASAEASRLVQEAEARAASMRQDAQALADKVKQEGARQADSVMAKAGSNPLVQAAAKPVADRIRKQSDDKAAAMVGEANRRADSLVAAARRQANPAPGER